MKKLIALSAIFFAVVLTSNVFAQNTDQATASASAKLVTAIDITKVNDLLFGDIAYKPVASTITILPQEDLDIDYSIDEMELTTATRQAAKFTVTGESNYLFSISLPETVTLSNGTSEMTIDTDMNLEAANNTLTGGSVDLYVGGTLNLSATQTTGQYNGNFNVTVAYE